MIALTGIPAAIAIKPEACCNGREVDHLRAASARLLNHLLCSPASGWQESELATGSVHAARI